MEILSPLIVAGKLSLNTVTTESSSAEGLILAANGDVVKRTLGTMAFQSSGDYLTSVGLNLPGIFNVTNPTATPSNNTLTAALANQTANTVFAGPNGANGTPVFRSLAAADIPTLEKAKINGLQTELDTKLAGYGTANYLAKYTGPAGLGTSQILDDGTYVGIGFASPTQKLHVNGNILLSATGRIGFNNDIANYYIGRIANGLEYRPYSVGNFNFTSGGGVWNFENGTTTFANNVTFGANAIIATAPVSGNHATNRTYVDNKTWAIGSVTGLQGQLDAKLSGAGTIHQLAKYTGGLTQSASQIQDNGTIGIYTSAMSGQNIRQVKNITGASTAYMYYNAGDVQLDVNTAVGYYTLIGTGADANPVNIRHFFAAQGSYAGFAQNQYGYSVSSSLVGATNNYAFWSNIPAGTGRWGFVDAGGANNSFAGNVWIGTTTGTYKLDVNGTAGFTGEVNFSSNAIIPTAPTLGNHATNKTYVDGKMWAISSVTDLQTTLNGKVGGTGTANYVPKFATTNTVANSLLYDNGSGIGIGVSSFFARSLSVSQSISGAATSFGILTNGVVQSGVTTAAYYNRTTANTQAASFTLPILAHYGTFQSAFGAGSTVTTQYGFHADASLAGAASNIGYYSGIATAVGKDNWNAYFPGSAPNHMQGSLWIGTTTSSYKLDVNGTARFVGGVTFDAIPVCSVNAVSGNQLVNLNTLLAYTSGIKYDTAKVKTVAMGNITLSGNQAISGYTTTNGDRVLLMGQTTGSQNGVYIASNSGWARDTNFDTDTEIRGAIHTIENGTYAGYKYINVNTSAITVGTTTIAYAEFSSLVETDPVFTASAAYSVTSGKMTNWDAAYGWGNHASAGYASAASISGSANYIAKYTSSGAISYGLLYDNGSGIGIGTNDFSARALSVSQNISGAATSFGVLVNGVVQSNVTTAAYYYRTSGNTQAASFTLPTLIHYGALQNSIGAGSAVTNQYAFHVDTLTGAGTNTAYYSNIGGSNNWNAYFAGNAPSHIAGSLRIGATASSTYKLDVSGTGRFTGDLNIEGKLRLNNITGVDHQFVKFDGTNTVWAVLNTGELEDKNDIVMLGNYAGERGFQLYSDTAKTCAEGIVFTNPDTGIIGLHGYKYDGEVKQYGINIDRDGLLYHRKLDKTRARILTTDDVLSGGNTWNGGLVTGDIYLPDYQSTYWGHVTNSQYKCRMYSGVDNNDGYTNGAFFLVDANRHMRLQSQDGHIMLSPRRQTKTVNDAGVVIDGVLFDLSNVAALVGGNAKFAITYMGSPRFLYKATLIAG